MSNKQQKTNQQINNKATKQKEALQIIESIERIVADPDLYNFAGFGSENSLVEKEWIRPTYYHRIP
jgi:hypothetical protein